MPAARILVRVDHSALMRGYAQGDETCDISGVGPVPVSTLGQLWPDAVVKAIITKGQAVTNVTHLGRRATEAMVAAMQFADPGCSNSTCDNAAFVEVDHRLGYANVGRTRTAGAARRGCSVVHPAARQLLYNFIEAGGGE